MLNGVQELLLASIFAPADLRTDAESLEIWGRDRTWQFPPCPSAIVFPREAAQVQELVRIAREQLLALTPSGGRTGLSGGAVAKHGEIVVSMDHMTRILDSNERERQIHLQAGVVTANLQDHAASLGLFYPVDFASSGSSQIGGNIATNAGGIRVLRYGGTRQWVAGLEVVTGTGELLDLNRGLIKNNTGYDLRHLLIGSEGTLGIILGARMLLTLPPREPRVLLLALQQFAHVTQIFRLAAARLRLTACEFFCRRALQEVLAHGDLRAPLATDHPHYILLEFTTEGADPLTPALEMFETVLDNGWAQDGVLAQSIAQNAALWRLREDVSESLAHYTPYKSDVAVLPSQIPKFLAAAEQLLNEQQAEFIPIWFGHIGDGNLHLNIPCPAGWAPDDFHARCLQISEELFRLLRKFGGSISAEHGVGLLKKDFLHYTRDTGEIALMRGVKELFDPDNILNPGKLF